jgi:hypothetical protein
MGFFVPIKLPGFGSGGLFVFKGSLKTIFHESFAGFLNGAHIDMKRSANLFIAPCWTSIGTLVSFKKNLCPDKFPGPYPSTGRNMMELLSFCLCQSDDVLLVGHKGTSDHGLDNNGSLLNYLDLIDVSSQELDP